MGWVGDSTQRGVSMTGSFSTSARTSSKERLPDPITIEARNSIVGTPDSRRMRPTCLAARQVTGQPVSLAQAAEIDDPPHARLPGGAGELPPRPCGRWCA